MSYLLLLISTFLATAATGKYLISTVYSLVILFNTNIQNNGNEQTR